MTNISTSLPGGVFAAALTPLTEKLEPDMGPLIAHAKWLLEHGCDGLAILGSTGEANCLTMEQRGDVIAAVGAALPTERLLIGTGACAIADAITLTRAAVDLGMKNVLVLPPFYYRPVSDDGVYRYYSALIEAIGDTNLRIYLYNFPQMTGFSFSSALITRLRDEFGAVIAGMKDSSGDWDHMRDMCRTQPGFHVFAGTEAFLLDIMRAGGVGCISATANVTSAMCQKVYQAWSADDQAADAQQTRLTATRKALQAYPAVPTLKSLMGDKGMPADARWQYMLPPFVPLADEARHGIAADLAGLAFAGPGNAAEAA